MSAGNVFGITKGTDADSVSLSLNSGANASRGQIDGSESTSGGYSKKFDDSSTIKDGSQHQHQMGDKVDASTLDPTARAEQFLRDHNFGSADGITIGMGFIAGGVGTYGLNKRLNNPIGKAFRKGSTLYHEQKGHIQGNNGEWYDPNKRGKGGVEEYLDKNKGSKSYLDPSFEPTPSAPNTNATTHPTASNPAENVKSPNMESSLNDLPNYIKNGDINQILQMDSSDIAKDALKSQINEKIGQLDATDAKYLEQKSGFDSLMSKIDSGAEISATELRKAGVDSKGFSMETHTTPLSPTLQLHNIHLIVSKELILVSLNLRA